MCFASLLRLCLLKGFCWVCFLFFKASFFSWDTDFFSSWFPEVVGSYRPYVKCAPPLKGLWEWHHVFPYPCVRFLSWRRNSLELSVRYSWNRSGSFCPNSLLLPTLPAPGNGIEEGSWSIPVQKCYCWRGFKLPQQTCAQKWIWNCSYVKCVGCSETRIPAKE